jgi:TatD DNase family protein
MLIDTHAHLNFNSFKDDADEVIRRSLENNVWMINVGSQYETSKRAVEIAEKHENGVFAAIGLHPIHLSNDLVKIKNDTEEIEIKSREESFDYERYKELAQSQKVVAIGEIGLDYYWKPKTKARLELFKEKQASVLCQQLNLAKELNLPVIFHCRMAHQDLIQFLKENDDVRPPAAVSHGFVGKAEELKEYLNLGYYVGFNGIIFKKIEGINFEENIRQTPLEKILIETDCPYLTPSLPAEALAEAGPKQNRNEPLYAKYIAQKIAEIKNVSFEKIAEITTQNAKNLFEIQLCIKN